MQFHLYELPRTGKFIETEGRRKVTRGYGKGKWGVIDQQVWNLGCRWQKKKKKRQLWCLHNNVSVFNATKLYTLK